MSSWSSQMFLETNSPICTAWQCTHDLGEQLRAGSVPNTPGHEKRVLAWSLYFPRPEIMSRIRWLIWSLWSYNRAATVIHPHLNPWEEASLNSEQQLETAGDEKRKEPLLIKRMRKIKISRGMHPQALISSPVSGFLSHPIPVFLLPLWWEQTDPSKPSGTSLHEGGKSLREPSLLWPSLTGKRENIPILKRTISRKSTKGQGALHCLSL